MAHSNVAGSTTSTDKIISSIRLPDGNVYEVHDSSAIHDVSELGLSAALVFKGSKPTVDELPAAGNKVGDVWLVTANNTEYVWTRETISGNDLSTTLINETYLVFAHLKTTSVYTKEQLMGATVVTHDDFGDASIVITESHITQETDDGLTFTLGTELYIWVAYTAGYNNLPSVGVYFSSTSQMDNQRVLSLTLVDGRWEAFGGVHDAASSTHKHNIKTFTGHNENSTFNASVNIPTVQATQKYLTASTTIETQNKSSSRVLGENTTFNATVNQESIGVSTVVGDVSVGANGTADAIVGFETHTTAEAITELSHSSINNPTVTPVQIPNVTDTEKVEASHVTVSNGSAPSWSASVSNGILSFEFAAGTTPSIVTSNPVEATKVTLGENIVASNVSTYPLDVVTGSKSRVNAITALGTPRTAAALTGVKVITQPTVSLQTVTQGNGDIQIPKINGVNISASGDIVTSLTDFILDATTRLTASSTSQVGATAFVPSVDVGSTPVTITGEVAAQKWVFDSGETDIPKE